MLCAVAGVSHQSKLVTRGTHEVHDGAVGTHEVDDLLPMREHLAVRHIDLDEVPRPRRSQPPEFPPRVPSRQPIWYVVHRHRGRLVVVDLHRVRRASLALGLRSAPRPCLPVPLFALHLPRILKRDVDQIDRLALAQHAVHEQRDRRAVDPAREQHRDSSVRECGQRSEWRDAFPHARFELAQEVLHREVQGGSRGGAAGGGGGQERCGGRDGREDSVERIDLKEGVSGGSEGCQVWRPHENVLREAH